MRCSSCEPYLGAYVEGELSPQRARAVRHHLSSCTACGAFYDRLRNVDALLFTARRTELEPDFVKGVMSQVYAMPAHRPRSKTIDVLLSLAGAWLFGAALIAIFWRTILGPGSGALREAQSALQAVDVGARAIWPIAPLATTAGVTMLAIDALLLAGTLVFYRSVRPRLATHLATGRRPRS